MNRPGSASIATFLSNFFDSHRSPSFRDSKEILEPVESAVVTLRFKRLDGSFETSGADRVTEGTNRRPSLWYRPEHKTFRRYQNA